MLKESRVSIQQVKQVFYVAGPGFYTGLRISHGMADMLCLLGSKLVNIYNFEIPAVLGEESYTWVTKAYRGEVFVYSSVDKMVKLVPEKEFLQQNWSGKIFIHHQSALDQNMLAKLSNTQQTEELLLNNVAKALQWSKASNSLRELYYFRPPEEEFKPSV